MKIIKNHPVTWEVVAIALPMVMSQACDTLMIFTDRLFLSRLGPTLMSAAMGGGLSAFVMMTFFLGLIGYTTALAAQYLGSNRKNTCAVVLTQALIIACIAYPLIVFARPVAYRFFLYMNIGEAQLADQVVYFNILIYGCIFSLFRGCFCGFFSGIGRTRVVMMASVIGMMINIVMNYVLIFGACGFPALGIRGAAYGTIIGNFGAVVILVGAYIKKRIRDEYAIVHAWRYDATVMKQLLKFGSPAGGEMFLNLLAFNTLVMSFHGHSAVTATASTIMFNWDLVAFVPLIGIEIGVTSLVGRYMGGGDPDTAHHATWAGFKLALVYSFIIFVLFCIMPNHLVSLFHPAGDDMLYRQAVPLAVFMIRVAALYVLVDALIVAFIGALRGAGDTVWAMMLTVGLHWAAAIGAFVALRVCGLTPEVGWITVVSAFVCFSGVIYWRYHHGAWRTMRVVR